MWCLIEVWPMLHLDWISLLTKSKLFAVQRRTDEKNHRPNVIRRLIFRSNDVFSLTLMSGHDDGIVSCNNDCRREWSADNTMKCWRRQQGNDTKITTDAMKKTRQVFECARLQNKCNREREREKTRRTHILWKKERERENEQVCS